MLRRGSPYEKAVSVCAASQSKARNRALFCGGNNPIAPLAISAAPSLSMRLCGYLLWAVSVSVCAILPVTKRSDEIEPCVRYVILQLLSVLVYVASLPSLMRRDGAFYFHAGLKLYSVPPCHSTKISDGALRSDVFGGQNARGSCTSSWCSVFHHTCPLRSFHNLFIPEVASIENTSRPTQ